MPVSQRDLLPIGFCLAALITMCPATLHGQLINPTAPLPQCNFASELEARIPVSIDAGLQALAGLQADDGSFPSLQSGQPGVTSLAIMAFLSRGHGPGVGPYGKRITRAIDYVLDQQNDSGMLSFEKVDERQETYNHAISMLMLGEVFGLTTSQQTERVRNAIRRGSKFTVRLWDIRKKVAEDRGGFRYVTPFNHKVESDISVTAWHMASLRSIRNAGFDVPRDVPERIATYAARTFVPEAGKFKYAVNGPHSPCTVMTAAGTLTLLMCGKFDDPSVLPAARSMAALNVEDYRKGGTGRGWPYYLCYYTSQAAAQLGGETWQQCNMNICEMLCTTQNADGLWPGRGAAAKYGKCYSTSMAVLSLTTQYQLLPIYQN